MAAATLLACCAARADPPLSPASDKAAVTEPDRSTGFTIRGELAQGGWIIGRVPAGAVAVVLDGQALALDPQGWFFGAFDRDAPAAASLAATLGDGRQLGLSIAVSPRSWQIEHIDAARLPGGATEAFLARRRPELERINAARRVNAASDGWRQHFIWPVKGRISGRFGSQRIYRGEPGQYHSGLDISTGTGGTPFVAPADGVVVLAAQQPFALEGHLLMIDHGMGLTSAFLHCSRLSVQEGDYVTQGQVIGRIGATGRATGPHLHWGIKWREARLDPLLFTGPMP